MYLCTQILIPNTMAKEIYRRYMWLTDTIRSAKNGITFEQISDKWQRCSLNLKGEELPKLLNIGKVTTLIIFLLWAKSSYAQYGENLLENSGFENRTLMANYIFPGWLCHNNSNVVQSNDYVYEGKYSAKMSSRETGSTAIVNQVVPVIPNSKIRIRHHYYITQWKDKGARMYCYFRERSAESSTLSNDYLKEFYDTKTLRIIRGGGYDLTYFPHEQNQWLLFDETIIVPPDAYYFVFEIHSFFGTTMYVDDCYVGQENISNITEAVSELTPKSYYSISGEKLNNKPSKGTYITKEIDAKGCVISRKYLK